jgi:hypothetical protein
MPYQTNYTGLEWILYSPPPNSHAEWRRCEQEHFLDEKPVAGGHVLPIILNDIHEFVCRAVLM